MLALGDRSHQRKSAPQEPIGYMKSRKNATSVLHFPTIINPYLFTAIYVVVINFTMIVTRHLHNFYRSARLAPPTPLTEWSDDYY